MPAFGQVRTYGLETDSVQSFVQRREELVLGVPRKFGSTTAIGGAVFLIVGTMLHPLGADPGDHLAAFAEYAADDGWVASHLCQFVGVALMFTVLVAVNDSLREVPDAWPARLGVYVGTAALTMTAALQAVDGIALKAMVDHWAIAADEDKQAAFLAALTVRQIEVGVASFMAILFGTTFVLFGWAIVQSDVYPRWLGWLGIGGGAGTVLGGFLTAFSGFSEAAMNVAMPFNLVLVLWTVTIGFYMSRDARSQNLS